MFKNHVIKSCDKKQCDVFFTRFQRLTHLWCTTGNVPVVYVWWHAKAALQQALNMCASQNEGPDRTFTPWVQFIRRTAARKRQVCSVFCASGLIKQHDGLGGYKLLAAISTDEEDAPVEHVLKQWSSISEDTKKKMCGLFPSFKMHCHLPQRPKCARMAALVPTKIQSTRTMTSPTHAIRLILFVTLKKHGSSEQMS